LIERRNMGMGKSDPAFSRWRAIKRVPEPGGVMFLDDDGEAGSGVRLRKLRQSNLDVGPSLVPGAQERS
jgi:hypothetical protein